MVILGLNAYHGDAAACIIRDGKIVTAVEEERFRRIKHWAGFPQLAVAYCLKEAGLQLEDVDYIAVNRDNRANLTRKIAYVVKHRPGLNKIVDRLKNRAKFSGVEDDLKTLFKDNTFKGKVRYIEHHLAHLSSAFYCSPYQEAAVASIDGFGDFASSAWGAAEGTSVSVDGRIYYPHSLGIFYQALTQYLGFLHYGDEYKVMGLAAYGDRSLVEKVRPIVNLLSNGGYQLDLTYFRHASEDIEYEWRGGEPHNGILFSEALEDLLGPKREPNGEITDHVRNVARATQAVFEDSMFSLLGSLHKRYGSENLSLAGGCAYNSVANGKLADRTPFRNSYIQSGAGDAGGAVGAALVVWHELGNPRGGAMPHAYLGPRFDDAEIDDLLRGRDGELSEQGCTIDIFDDEAALCRTTAKAIADGKVVGWFQGRMEWGPRALGNRSILGDPRRADMKQILNLKIKRRESFRPFAPSILREAVKDWFEQDDDVPFMTKVFGIQEEQRTKIPAVAHVDGTGRLQTVHRDANPIYHRLISEFHEITGVPMVLNTSFNENEPIVCTPGEALDCFLRTKMDVIVLGSRLVRRSAEADVPTDISLAIQS